MGMVMTWLFKTSTGGIWLPPSESKVIKNLSGLCRHLA